MTTALVLPLPLVALPSLPADLPLSSRASPIPSSFASSSSAFQPLAPTLRRLSSAATQSRLTTTPARAPASALSITSTTTCRFLQLTEPPPPVLSPPASLTSLPNELLYTTFSHLPLQSLLALRGSCKLLRGLTTSPVLETYLPPARRGMIRIWDRVHQRLHEQKPATTAAGEGGAVPEAGEQAGGSGAAQEARRGGAPSEIISLKLAGYLQLLPGDIRSIVSSTAITANWSDEFLLWLREWPAFVRGADDEEEEEEEEWAGLSGVEFYSFGKWRRGAPIYRWCPEARGRGVGERGDGGARAGTGRSGRLYAFGPRESAGWINTLLEEVGAAA